MRFSQYMLKLISFMLLVVFSATLVSAFGMSPPSISIVHEGSEIIEYEIRLLGGDRETDVDVFVIGDMAEFVEVETSKLTIPVEGTTLKYVVNVPEELPPGKHKSVVIIQESAIESDEGSGKGAFQLRSAIGHVIKVYGTSNQKYAEVKFDADNVNVGEKVIFSAHVENLGGFDIEDAYGNISVFDPSGNLVKKLSTNHGSYYTGMVGNLYAHWTANDVSAGRYLARLDFSYDGIVDVYETEFMIGDVFIEPVKISPPNFTKGGIKQINLEVKNYWSEQIDLVYADFIMPNVSAKSSPISLRAFETGNLNAYINTDRMVSGVNDVVAIVYYGDGSSSETFSVEVFVDDDEKDYSIYYIAFAILILILIIIWLVRRKL